MGKLNDWLGVVTNVGLIAGLLLVAYEVNQTNLAMERDYAALMNTTQFASQQMFVDWTPSVVDPENAEVWWLGISGAELNPVDRERFYRLTESYFWTFYSMSTAWASIFPDGGQISAKNLAIDLSTRPGLKEQFLDFHARYGLNPFGERVIASLQGIDP